LPATALGCLEASNWARFVDAPVALLGYGNVGSAVDRLLVESADEIEQTTGHRLRVVRALVRDLQKDRAYPPAAGVLTTDFARIRDDPSIQVVAEAMGGLEPAGSYVLELLRAGKSVVTANKQLVARRGTELFAAASEAGVQLRFEASVCAGIPVIKVLREALVVSKVNRVLGIVNGTTNFVLSEMERGQSYEEALEQARLAGIAEADPTEDLSGADAAAKMSILATVAFGSRVTFDDVHYEGIEGITQAHVNAARALNMVVRLVGSATHADGKLDVRVRPSLVDRGHPLATVDGAFNAVLLQGEAIREIMLAGPGAGGEETASAVIADIVSVIGTNSCGFLQNDSCWRALEHSPETELHSPFYVHLVVEDKPDLLEQVDEHFAAHGVSVAQVVRGQGDTGVELHVLTHPARATAIGDALEAIEAHAEGCAQATFPVICEGGVAERQADGHLACIE
jgi:homoserine dehydrogenase